MMRIDGLGSSLLFGALAAMGLVFVENLLVGLRLATPTLPVYLLGCLVVYATLLGADGRPALRLGFVAGLAGGAVLLVAGSAEGVAVGLTAVLALVRTGLDPRTRTARALGIEALLGILALSVALWAGGPGWLEQAAGLWSYALVQGLHFLLPITSVRGQSGGEGDDFERAHARISSLLEEM